MNWLRFPPWRKRDESILESFSPQNPSQGPPIPEPLKEGLDAFGLPTGWPDIVEGTIKALAISWKAEHEHWEKMTPEEQEAERRKQEAQREKEHTFEVRMHGYPFRPGVLPFSPFAGPRYEIKAELVNAKNEYEARLRVFVPIGYHIDSVRKLW